MRNKRTITLIAAVLVLCVIGVVLVMINANASARRMDELLDQLMGKADSPEWNATEMMEAYQEAVDHLIPLMSAKEVESRYEPQILFQDLGSYAARPGAVIEREALANVMVNTLEQTTLEPTVRNWFVQQLGRIGAGESVPALAEMMKSEDINLRDYARQALETNPDQSATDALLTELTSAEGSTWKIGLINSLGQRGAEAAVPQIVQALDDRDQGVAEAAATALGNIGDAASTQALMGVINDSSSPIYLEAGQGLIEIAQGMIAGGNSTRATRIFTALSESVDRMASSSSELALSGIRSAAVIGRIMYDPVNAARIVASYVQDDDPRVQAAAVHAARVSPSTVSTSALARILSSAGAGAQVQLLGLLAERGETSTINTITGFVSSDDQAVCLAAISALSAIGTEAAARPLLRVAVSGDDVTAEAAQQGLAVMTGVGVEEFVKAQAATGNAGTRSVAIKLLGQRQTPGAAANLYGYAAESNEEISVAAFSALADVAIPDDINTLVEILGRTRGSEAMGAGIATLRIVLSQAEDKEAAARTLNTQMNRSNEAMRVSLLSTLDALGGSTALAAVNEAALSSDEAMRDAGIRTLSSWPDFEATGTLLEIASNPSTSLTHYVLAHQGVLRLIQSNNSVLQEDREELCLSAFDQARRDEERIQAISAMGSLASVRMGERLLEIAEGVALQAEAGMAALQVASSMLRSDEAAAQELAQAVLDLNISEDLNSTAEQVKSGQRLRFGGGNFGGGGFPGGGPP